VYHILVIDDDIYLLEVMKEMLNLSGHSVTAIHDSYRVLNLIGENNYDLVIADINMPGVDGWRIARAVKVKNNDAPVVLISALATNYENEDLDHKGVDLLYAKSVNWLDLILDVENLVLYAKKRIPIPASQKN